MKLFADLTNDLCMWLTSCPQMFCCVEQVAETNTLNELLLTKCGFLLVTVIALLIMFNFVVRWWNDRLIIRDQRLESRPSYFQWKITTNSICAAETKLKKNHGEVPLFEITNLLCNFYRSKVTILPRTMLAACLRTSRTEASSWGCRSVQPNWDKNHF